MKNNLFIIKFIYFLFLITNLSASNLEVNSSQVKIDKKESKNLQTLEDKIGKLQQEIQRLLGKNYVKKNPLDITTSTQTVAVLRTDYQIYIKTFSKQIYH